MEESGFHNIDSLPLGSLLQIKQGEHGLGKHRKKSLSVHKLLEKGFPHSRPTK